MFTGKICKKQYFISDQSNKNINEYFYVVFSQQIYNYLVQGKTKDTRFRKQLTTEKQSKTSAVLFKTIFNCYNS